VIVIAAPASESRLARDRLRLIALRVAVACNRSISPVAPGSLPPIAVWGATVRPGLIGERDCCSASSQSARRDRPQAAGSWLSLRFKTNRLQVGWCWCEGRAAGLASAIYGLKINAALSE
jgi:hypothetical protein